MKAIADSGVKKIIFFHLYMQTQQGVDVGFATTKVLGSFDYYGRITQSIGK